MMMMMMITMIMMMMPGYPCCPVFFLMQCAGKSSEGSLHRLQEVQWTKHGANKASQFRIYQTILKYILIDFQSFKTWIRVGLKKNAMFKESWYNTNSLLIYLLCGLQKRTKCMIMIEKKKICILCCVPQPIRIFSNNLLHANWEYGNIIFLYLQRL